LKIAFSNDHAALESRPLIKWLKDQGHEVDDFGTDSTASVDYPNMAAPALAELKEGKVERVVLVCGSGVGMSIVANRVPGIRCALVTDLYAAEMSRRHNNSNCLALRSRHQSEELNLQILKLWLETDFEGGRHERRIEEIETVGEVCSATRQLENERKALK